MENQRNLKRLLNVLNKKSSIINIILEVLDDYMKLYNFIDKEDPLVIPVKYTNYNIFLGFYFNEKYINNIDLSICNNYCFLLRLEKDLEVKIKVDEFILNPSNFFSYISKELNEMIDNLSFEIKKIPVHLVIE